MRVKCGLWIIVGDGAERWSEGIWSFGGEVERKWILKLSNGSGCKMWIVIY